MSELFIIKNNKNHLNPAQPNEIDLHEDIFNILFKYKEKICSKFEDIRGFFLIDHFAITIIAPNKKTVILSTTPSVEYNLLAQDLWKHDKGFSINHQINNTFYSWESAYSTQYFDELKLIKQIRHGFTFGFNLSKKSDKSQLIYSFATRSSHPEFLEYYGLHMNELFSIGDYIYKSMQPIIPMIASKPFLRLISNNNKET
jgi:hypothetical protein